MANIVCKNCVLCQIEIKKKNGTVLNTDRAESDQLTLLLNKLYTMDFMLKLFFFFAFQLLKFFNRLVIRRAVIGGAWVL